MIDHLPGSTAHGGAQQQPRGRAAGMGKKRGKGVPSTATPKDRRLKANGGGKRTS